MTDRQRSIARVVALQGKMQTIAAAKLAAADAQHREIAASREALQAYVATAELTGALAVHAITATRVLVAREADAASRRKSLAAARQTVETKLKLAERLAETLKREDAADAERRALERLIEEAVTRGPAEG